MSLLLYTPTQPSQTSTPAVQNVWSNLNTHYHLIMGLWHRELLWIISLQVCVCCNKEGYNLESDYEGVCLFIHLKLAIQMYYQQPMNEAKPTLNYKLWIASSTTLIGGCCWSGQAVFLAYYVSLTPQQKFDNPASFLGLPGQLLNFHDISTIKQAWDF